MNEKIMESDLSKIEYFRKEIEKIEENLQKVKEERDELLKSMAKYFPFKAEDVVINGNEIFRIHSSGIDTRIDTNNDVYYRVYALISYNGSIWKEQQVKNILLSEISKYRKINE